MIRKVVADAAPEVPPGVFSNCLVVGDTVYLSGQHARAPDGGVLGDGSMGDQTRQAFNKVKALVEAAGGTMADVVKVTIYVTDMGKRAEVNAVRREFFAGDYPPCSTLVGVTALASPGLTVEVDAVAVIGASKRA